MFNQSAAHQDNQKFDEQNAHQYHQNLATCCSFIHSLTPRPHLGAWQKHEALCKKHLETQDLTGAMLENKLRLARIPMKLYRQV